jgi:cob(I)alamin adenosyltransferase
MGLKLGTIQVYTGNGKGKTTAAIGQALRAIGHRLNVIIIQFMKGEINYGEVIIAKEIKNLTIEQWGRKEFVNKNNPLQIDIQLANKALKRAKEVIENKQYDIVILDEINVAIDYNLIKEEEVITLLKTKPKEIEVILTGRGATPRIIEIADTVSEVKEVKHHYQKGIKAREGIEY